MEDALMMDKATDLRQQFNVTTNAQQPTPATQTVILSNSFKSLKTNEISNKYLINA